MTQRTNGRVPGSWGLWSLPASFGVEFEEKEAVLVGPCDGLGDGGEGSVSLALAAEAAAGQNQNLPSRPLSFPVMTLPGGGSRGSLDGARARDVAPLLTERDSNS